MKKHFLHILFFFIIVSTYAQNNVAESVNASTPGTLTITTTTVSAGGKYSPRNIVAIWIQDPSGKFVKSMLVYANSRINDLSTWTTNSAKNKVDAVTAATQSSHATRTCTWKGTNVSAATVPDGTYTVKMEMNDGNAKVATYTFIKGSATTTGTVTTSSSSFSNVSIQWVPTVTEIDEVKLANLYSIYPNPAKPSIFVNGSDIQQVEIFSLAGKSILKTNEQNINLSSLEQGSYLVQISTSKGTFIKKIIKE